jgi:hypothetical protein
MANHRVETGARKLAPFTQSVRREADISLHVPGGTDCLH